MEENKEFSDNLNELKSSLSTNLKLNDENNKPEVHISGEDMRSLKNSNYRGNKNKYDTSYVIENNKTGVIVEVYAASSMMASKMMKWRPRHTTLIQENKREDK